MASDVKEANVFTRLMQRLGVRNLKHSNASTADSGLIIKAASAEAHAHLEQFAATQKVFQHRPQRQSPDWSDASQRISSKKNSEDVVVDNTWCKETSLDSSENSTAVLTKNALLQTLTEQTKTEQQQTDGWQNKHQQRNQQSNQQSNQQIDRQQAKYIHSNQLHSNQPHGNRHAEADLFGSLLQQSLEQHGIELKDTSILDDTPAQYTPLLDLHGYTKVEAEQAVEKFLEQSARNFNKVCIITGRGNNSAHKAVLRYSVPEFLEQSASVLSYKTAKPKRGGQGVLVVRLKQPR